MAKLSFLHISDLHYSAADLNRNWVLTAFLEDIERRAARHAPDFVLFSGDLVQAGDKDTDFTAVKKAAIDPLLTLLGLAPDRFFLTPGNHDIQRSKAPAWMDSGLDKTLITSDDIDRFVETYDSDYAPISARQENYRRFVSTARLGCPVLVTPTVTVHRCSFGGRTVGIACFNTALRATGRDGGFDYNRMVMGVRQIQLAVPHLADCDVRIANLHHAVEWLVEVERQDVRNLLHASFDVVAFGHSHRAAAENTRAPETQVLLSNPGALYEATKRCIGYSCVTLKDTTWNITARTYFKDRHAFDIGVNTLPMGSFSMRMQKKSVGRRRSKTEAVLPKQYPALAVIRERKDLGATPTGALLSMLAALAGKDYGTIGERASGVVAELVSRKRDILRGHRFEHLCLRHADFSGADLTGATFTRCDLGDAYFADVRLDNAVFDEVDLRGAQFVEIDSFRAVDWSPQGIVCAGSGGALVQVAPTRVLKGHGSSVLAIKTSGCGKYQAAAHESGMVYIWQPLESREPVISPLRKYQAPVYALCWNPNDSRELVSSGRDGSIVVWNWQDKRMKREVANHSEAVLSLDWNRCGPWLASAGIDRTVQVWDVTKWVSVRGAAGHKDYVRVVRWRDGEWLMSGGDDGSVRLWRWDGQELYPSGTIELGSAVLSAAWHPEHPVLALGLRDDSIVFWSMGNLNKPRTRPIRRIKLHVGRVWDLCWSETGNELVSVGNDGTIVRWCELFEPSSDRLLSAGNIAGSAELKTLRVSCFGLRLNAVHNACVDGYERRVHKDRDWDVEECSLLQWLASKGAVLGPAVKA